MKVGISLFVAAFLAVPVAAQTVNFGDDASQWANDGECDDRRFTGQKMDTELDNDDILHDAKDCREAYDAGLIQFVDRAAARAATVCSAIQFGQDSSEWANDGECDDYRFEGTGMSSTISAGDIGRDASDCKRLCDMGTIFLREY
jgi:hypothetical protein